MPVQENYVTKPTEMLKEQITIANIFVLARNLRHCNYLRTRCLHRFLSCQSCWLSCNRFNQTEPAKTL